MAKVTVYNLQGESTGSAELPEKIFSAPAKNDAVHQVVVAEQAALRNNVSHTKLRGEVRGGGRKPWKQKGTGRARAGSIRSPIWKGGGVVFGPRNNRNYKKKINRSQFRTAIASIFSDKLANKSLFIVDKFDFSDIKTKQFFSTVSELQKKLNITAKKVNLVVPDKASNLVLSARNIPNINIIPLSRISPMRLLQGTATIILQDEISAIEDRFFKK